MAAQRQDAWTEEEDVILAEIVLKHIREGSTQLSAFQEVGNRLSRTAAACGFRWNSTIRKKYEKSIVLAKEQRKSLQTEHDRDMASKEYSSNITFDDVIAYLRHLLTFETKALALEDENEQLRHELETTKKEYDEKIKKLMEMNDTVQKDYKTMLEIMKRASKLVSDKNEASS